VNLGASEMLLFPLVFVLTVVYLWRVLLRLLARRIEH
jgi:hypothetical protein